MSGEFQRSLGLELAGGKNSRSAVAVLDFFPRSERLIVSEIVSNRLHPAGDPLGDESLVADLKEMARKSKGLAGLGVSGPISLPPLFDPKKTPAAVKSEVQWMSRLWESLEPKPRPFAHYLQRPSEVWLRHKTPDRFGIGDGLGSNCAPLAARLNYLRKRLPSPLLETYPRGAVLRLVKSLGVHRSLATLHSDLERGVEMREDFFRQLLKKVPRIFIYEGDLEAMILNLNQFYAFVSALTVFLRAREQTDTAPRGFPRSATWIHLPKSNVDWDKALQG